jgi:hypothetical protein
MIMAETLRIQKEAARLEAIEPVLKVLRPIAEELADGRGGLRDSIASGLKKGEIPSTRGFVFMIEMLAKDKGRQRCLFADYNAEKDRLYDLFDRIVAGEFDYN